MQEALADISHQEENGPVLFSINSQCDAGCSRGWNWSSAKGRWLCRALLSGKSSHYSFRAGICLFLCEHRDALPQKVAKSQCSFVYCFLFFEDVSSVWGNIRYKLWFSTAWEAVCLRWSFWTWRIGSVKNRHPMDSNTALLTLLIQMLTLWIWSKLILFLTNVRTFWTIFKGWKLLLTLC